MNFAAQLQTLLETAALARTHAVRLRSLLDWRQSVDARADAKLAELEQTEVFRRSPAAHKKQVRAELAAEYRALAEPAAGVGLFTLERALPTLDADVRALRKAASRPPAAVDCYLARTGGQRINLTDHVELSIEQLDELRRARFRADFADAPPSTVRDLYAEAVDSDTDEAASLVRFVEAKYGNGWAGPTPANDQQIRQATELQRLIASTRAARVPPELADIEELLEDCGRLVNRAQEVHRVRPINAEQPGYESARVAYESELRAIAEQQPELVEQ